VFGLARAWRKYGRAVAIGTRKSKNWIMSPDILAIIIATTVQVLVSVIGLSLLGWKLSQTLREIHEGVTQITAAVTFNVLQGRRIEEVLREMRESIGEIRGSLIR
jgi:hypothetical protein